MTLFIVVTDAAVTIAVAAAVTAAAAPLVCSFDSCSCCV